MATIQEVDRAIGAHVLWKTRLKTAIDTGRLDAAKAAITSGHDCPFGKWLSGPTIAPSTKASEHYARVAQLHTLFHTQAAKVGALALAGENTKAIEEITGASEFSAAHRDLAASLEDWKKALR